MIGLSEDNDIRTRTSLESEASRRPMKIINIRTPCRLIHGLPIRSQRASLISPFWLTRGRWILGKSFGSNLLVGEPIIAATNEGIISKHALFVVFPHKATGGWFWPLDFVFSCPLTFSPGLCPPLVQRVFPEKIDLHSSHGIGTLQNLLPTCPGVPSPTTTWFAQTESLRGLELVIRGKGLGPPKKIDEES